MSIATRAELFGRPVARRFRVTEPLPVQGVSVRLRSLLDSEISDYQHVYDAKGKPRPELLKNANARLICLCLVDEEGQPLCTPRDVPEVQTWDSADTLYLYEECAKHVGLRRGAVKDAEKNSDSDPAGDSSID